MIGLIESINILYIIHITQTHGGRQFVVDSMCPFLIHLSDVFLFLFLSDRAGSAYAAERHPAIDAADAGNEPENDGGAPSIFFQLWQGTNDEGNTKR